MRATIRRLCFKSAVLKRLWMQVSDQRTQRRLENSGEYAFRHDYVSRHTPLWERFLEPYRDRDNVRMLEIGSFEGASTIWFLENILTHPSSSITCVDPFSRGGGEVRFDHNLRISGLSQKVIKIKATSDEALLKMMPRSFDVIYIDGSHLARDVLLDAAASWWLLKSDGILIFDDYQWQLDRPAAQRPQLAIDIFLDALAPQLEVLAKDNQVIVRKSSFQGDEGQRKILS